MVLGRILAPPAAVGDGHGDHYLSALRQSPLAGEVALERIHHFPCIKVPKDTVDIREGVVLQTLLRAVPHDPVVEVDDQSVVLVVCIVGVVLALQVMMMTTGS